MQQLSRSFNSMIVRLKGNDSHPRTLHKDGFNSMIVRLKGPIQKQQRAFLAFQFYDSPIKSIRTLHGGEACPLVSIL